MRRKIYITDDEPALLDVLSAFLLHDGFAVETFSGGEEVLAACQRDVPDLVVLDIMMPGMDGLSVCRALRGKYPRLPIVIISSKDGSGDRAAGAAAGADDYLCKPFPPPKLSARIRTLLQNRQSPPHMGADSAADHRESQDRTADRRGIIETGRDVGSLPAPEDSR